MKDQEGTLISMGAKGITIDGTKLERARLSKRISVPDLATRIGCGKHHIRALERGLRNPSIEILGRLERELDITAEQLGADLPPAR
jgi:transcriptional regulator with XRE-family HTH domain